MSTVPTHQIRASGNRAADRCQRTTLSRVVRIAMTSGGTQRPLAHNTFAGFPSTNAVPLWTEFRVEVSGTPNRDRGYVTSLAQVDAATRSAAETALHLDPSAILSGTTGPAAVLRGMVAAITQHLGHPVARLTWLVSPYHHYSWEDSMPERTTIACQFEFAAAHRLNDPTLSPEANIALFGKCNRLNGHGHNYRLEVAVRRPERSPFGMADFERLVAETVVDKFDHKNLNVDCPEFAELNPTVEHIATVCFDLLERPLSGAGVELVRVTVWETSKTSATVEV